MHCSSSESDFSKLGRSKILPEFFEPRPEATDIDRFQTGS